MSLFRRPTEDAAPPEEASVAGERGIASVNRARSLQSRVSSVLAIGLMIPLVLALNWFVSRTSAGRAMRATAQDPEAARLMGLPFTAPLNPLAAFELMAELASERRL